jgi:hypothetical protein
MPVKEVIELFSQYPENLILRILDDMGLRDAEECPIDIAEKMEQALAKIQAKTKALKGGNTTAIAVSSPEVKDMAIEIENDFSLGISRKTISIAMSTLAVSAINDADELTSVMNSVFVARVQQNQEGFVKELTKAFTAQSADFRDSAKAIASEILKQATVDEDKEELKSLQDYLTSEAKKLSLQPVNPFEKEDSDFDLTAFMKASGFSNYGEG